MKVLVGAFNQEKALVEAFSMMVKVCCKLYRQPHLATALLVVLMRKCVSSPVM